MEEKLVPAASSPPGAGRLQSDLFVDLASSLDTSDVIERVLRRGLEVTRSDRATLSRLEPGTVVIEATLGRDGDISWRGRSYPLSTLHAQPAVHRCLDELRIVFGGRLDDHIAEPEFRSALREVKHTAAIPLLHDERAVGLLGLSRYSDAPYDEGDRAALDALSLAAGLALHNALVVGELEEARVELTSGLAAAADVSSQLDVQSVLARLLTRAITAAHADGGSLGTPQGTDMVIEAVAPADDGAATAPSSIVGSRWPLHPRTLEAMAAGEPVMLTAREYLQVPDGMEHVTASFRHFMVVPLLVQNTPVGLIALGRREDVPFTETDAARILTFGTLAALRLRNVRLQERAIDADRSRAEFMSAAVHEMRSPLTVISGYTDMALAENFGELSDGMRKALTTIARKSEELKRTVDELLTLTRLESGSLVASADEIDLVALARTAVERAQPRVRLRDGSVDLVSSRDAAPAHGDAQLVPRILDNLINNAIAYGGTAPQVTVTITVDEPAGQVHTDIHDRGPGISAAERAVIFEKFRRGSDAARSGAEGSGLGLYLSRGLAERMGGTLVLLDDDGDGSTFRLSLPR